MVVTGGTGALGISVVLRLVQDGATVHLPGLEGSLPGGLVGIERVHFKGGVNLTDEGAVRDYYAGVRPLWASIHLAGGFAMAPVVDTSLADFRAQQDLNLVTAFLACREAVRAMRRGGAGGRIVNVAARPALSPVGGMIAYATAKAGVVSLTQCLAEELKAERILVNAIAPSIIDSPANRAAMPKAPHATWPRPEELAETVAFLASPANALTSGAIVPVFGRA